jgi:SIR2-like domain
MACVMQMRAMKLRRVFLLGAGASKSWGLPLTNELFPLALTGVPKRKDRQLIRKFIQYQYPHFHRRWKNYPPLEEFLSLVEVYLDFADVIKRGHIFSIEEVARIKKELLHAITTVLHAAREEAAHSRVQKLGTLLEPGDTIITFNWDLLIEEALRDLGKDWEYDLRDNAISILKPHGSLDWFDSREVSIKSELVFPLNEKFKRILVFRRFRAPRTKSPAAPIILPPVANKSIKYKELQSIWRDAWRALRHADEIYILGYSLPPEDLHARFTIRSAIRANERFEGHKLNIAVVNPDRNVYLRFARLVEGSIKYYESGLQGVSLEELIASQ